MRVSIVPAQWPGDTIDDIRRVTRIAAELGCRSVWYSEVNGYDAVGLAAAMAAERSTGEMTVVVGPIPIGVRDPAQLAMGLATIDALTSSGVEVALGSSTPVVVEKWHGGPSGDPTGSMTSYVTALRTISKGEKSDHTGNGWSSHGFKLMVAPPATLQIRIAALGNRMLQLAGGLADGVVLNLVTPAVANGMIGAIRHGAAAVHRQDPPKVSLWLMAGSRDHALSRTGQLLRAYVDAPGYKARLDEAGLRDLARQDPRAAAERLGAFGTPALTKRLSEFETVGVDEVALVISGRDPAAEELLAIAVSR